MILSSDDFAGPNGFPTSATQGFDIEAFLNALELDPATRDRIRHVEKLPARQARYSSLETPLPERLVRALNRNGINRLYTHQARSIEAVRRGRNLVIVTGTASGKTLAYNLPTLERLLGDTNATALYLFPTKALAQDQLKGLTRLLDGDPELAASVFPGVFDGDTSQAARRSIRDRSRLILSNPDMLHRSILPYHGRWGRFFENLRIVVIDEVHTYRGIFGSNVANVIRRLRRVAAHYGADPLFISSSATIRNPQELAGGITGLDTVEISEDGSPRGPKWFVFWNPPFVDQAMVERRSSNVEGMDLLVRLVRNGVQSIVFTKARVVTELIFKYAREILLKDGRGLAGSLSPYRGGYLPSERREIERRLFSGELLGVVSTNALELGIDIGGLDASVLVGFPGTIASMWQQAGRAGRGERPALTIWVAYNDPIDQYLVRHPEYVFGTPPEAAVIDPCNPYILAGHLSAAAFELPLSAADQALFGDVTASVVEALVAEEKLTAIDDHHYWGTTDFPAGQVNLRTISDDTFTIVDVSRNNSVMGNVDAISAPELVYPEAIYLHEGETYFVQNLDMAERVAYVRPINVDYYTQPVLDSSIRVRALKEERRVAGERLTLHDATVTWATTMFKKIRFGSSDSIGYKNLDLPPQHLPTVSLGWSPSPEVRRTVRDEGRNPAEGLCGIRNLLITVLPLFAMCDRSDVGGIIDSSNLGTPTLFLYDRFTGGIGFSETGYLRFEELAEEALRIIGECPCREGCPSCVGLPILRPAQHQDPDLMHGFPIPDKAAALIMLESLVHELKPV